VGSYLSASARSDVFLHFQIIFDTESDNCLNEAEVLCPGPSAGLLALLTCFGLSTVSFTALVLGETHSHGRSHHSLLILFPGVLLQIYFLENSVNNICEIVEI
jgi:hypothetical protein